MKVSSFALSAFADEISPDLAIQVATLQRLGIPGLDVRTVNEINVLSLPPEVLAEVRSRMADIGGHVQCVGSPVNKVEYAPEAESGELEKLRKAIYAAHALGTRRIRIFSPANPPTDDAAITWMSAQLELAKAADVVLVHENDARYYGAYPNGAKLLFGALGGPHFRAAFDFANTVLIGFRPMADWFPWLLPHLDTLHIKDAREASHQVVPAGEGDGQMAETLRWLVDQSWNGPLTLEPHLQAAGTMGGFSGEQLFEVAVHALRGVLSSLEEPSSPSS